MLRYIHAFVEISAREIIQMKNSVFAIAYNIELLQWLIIVDSVYGNESETIRQLLEDYDFLKMIAEAKRFNQDGKAEITKINLKNLYNMFTTKGRILFWETGKFVSIQSLDEPMPHFEIHKNEQFNNEIELSNDDSEYRSVALRELKNGACILGVGDIWRVRNDLSEEICKLLNTHFSEEAYHFRMGDDEKVIAMLYEHEIEEMRIKDKIREIVQNRKMYLIASSDFDREFETLYVNELPFGKKADIRKCQNKNIILLPFNRTIYGYLETDMKGVSWKTFFDEIKKSPNFSGCVNWVLLHSEKIYNRKEVEEAYTKLCRKIFDMSKGESL